MNGDGYSRDSGRHSSSRAQHGYRDERRDRGDRGERDSRRRRSRSPAQRGSRRDYEVDTYSSSRDYREREREDRYQRRDDRGWDRDRGSRRDSRRDDDDRRRDRDPFEDRGGRGRRDRGDRDGFGGGGGGGGGGGRERKKSASPPQKKREPTPDLTNNVSILQHKRRMTQWDIKPAGYENVTAEQAKLSGMFPLPGAPRQQAMDPSRLQALVNQPAGSASGSALKPSNSKQAKRLFVYNIPQSVTETSLADFFNLQMNGLNVVSGIDPCLSAQVSSDRSFALLEFKTSEDATVGLALDGISMEDNDGQADRPGLSIRRPKEYIVPASGDADDYQEGRISDVVKDSPYKLSVSNIPVYLSEEQITELLAAFGELKAFVLAKDTGTEQSRGFAFCEYVEPHVTDMAVEGLNGMELGDGHLKCQRASIGLTQAEGLELGVNAMSLLAGTNSSELEKGRALMLLNMVTADELIDPGEYEEICEDVEEECRKFGPVVAVKIPRPVGGRENPGVGKIYVKYEDASSAAKAINALAGRKFSDRTVVVTYFSEELFDVDAW